MPFVRIKGVLLHYRLSGRPDGPALAFANSLGTDLRIWDEVVARLGQHYRIVCYDKRGHGLSDAPLADYTLDDHLDDLAGLLDHVGFATTALVGVSIGGLIAQGMALRTPARLTALVLCDTAPRVGDAAMWNGRIGAVLAGGPAAIADAVMDRWFTEQFRREHPDDLAGWRNLFVRTDTAGYASTCATLRDTDLTARIGTIATPTLVVAGELDRATPVDMVRDCAARIPRSRFEVLPGAGHIPSIEQPAALAALIDDFLKEVGGD
ncbi:MAG: 3-oxoadipate enol-lactonase [Devosia sp.]|nr:3-oxoadipate enol-lactonase [Devosia sp.]